MSARSVVAGAPLSLRYLFRGSRRTPGPHEHPRTEVDCVAVGKIPMTKPHSRLRQADKVRDRRHAERSSPVVANRTRSQAAAAQCHRDSLVRQARGSWILRSVGHQACSAYREGACLPSPRQNNKTQGQAFPFELSLHLPRARAEWAAGHRFFSRLNKTVQTQETTGRRFTLEGP